ncbi:NAD(P)H-dependent glycerol-3-phosphate dehydrogenase [Candidatus Daviesbacteria bacterium]|nr:NAD(P)H-dependent glycerol-3-phosphate dehydrogenase [Candidatus Daviesbacteria bacterium]
MEFEPKKIACLPPGQLASAFAVHLSRLGHEVRLGFRTPEAAETFQRTHRLPDDRRLPNIIFPDNVKGVYDPKELFDDIDIVVFAPPAQRLREYLERLSPYWPNEAFIVVGSKGIELHTHKLMSEVVREIQPQVSRLAVLSGPNLATLIAQGKPTGTVIAADKADVIRPIGSAFEGNGFVVEASRDFIGVQLVGALKNVGALATGMCNGMELDDNAESYIARLALQDITRITLAAGGHLLTLLGPAGFGDIYLSWAKQATRNFKTGVRIGRGEPLEKVFATTETVEGLYTARSAVELASALGVKVPVLEGVHKILIGELTPYQAYQQITEQRFKVRR